MAAGEAFGIIRIGFAEFGESKGKQIINRGSDTGGGSPAASTSSAE